MPKLHLHLLGSPKVEIDAQTADIPRRKALALLIYVVTQTITRKYNNLEPIGDRRCGQAIGDVGVEGKRPLSSPSSLLSLG